MPHFFTQIANAFIYKEPTDIELGFELLEDANEGNERKDKSTPDNQKPAPQPTADDKPQKKTRIEKKLEKANDISKNLAENLEIIKQKFLMPKNMDIIIREFNIGKKLKAFMVFIEDMADKKELNHVLLPQLMAKDVFEGKPPSNPVDYLLDNIISIHHVKKATQYHEAITSVLCGGVALFMEGCKECIVLEMAGMKNRNIERPLAEPVVKGSQEGFTENLDTNITLVRKVIKNERLVTEIVPVGNTNHSRCAVMYLDGVVNPQVVQEVMKRLHSINTDYIDGSGFVGQLIEDNPFMFLPQIATTERPDRTASFIMEGAVAVIANGTPNAFAVPCTFFTLMHTSEDMNLRFALGTFLRLIRYLGLLFSLLLPGIYIATTLYHPEVIPAQLLISITEARSASPFPTIFEVLLLETSFELIREGAIRVPGIIGPTLGIVGALILGQAAVAANLISPIMVIIVSMTAIGSFTISNYELGLALRVLRFLFIIAGGLLGFYGISLLFSLIILLAGSMKSFGVPYFAPVAPKTKTGRDTILRFPLFMQKERPDALNTPNRRRQGNLVKNWIRKAR